MAEIVAIASGSVFVVGLVWWLVWGPGGPRDRRIRSRANRPAPPPPPPPRPDRWGVKIRELTEEELRESPRCHIDGCDDLARFQVSWHYMAKAVGKPWVQRRLLCSPGPDDIRAALEPRPRGDSG